VPRSRLRLAIVGALLTGCGSPSASDRFEDEVVPVLENYCLGGACHGVGPNAVANGDVIDWDHFHVRVGTDLVVTDPLEAYANTKLRINTSELAELSSLLRKPLSLDAGGLPHAGGVQFDRLDSPPAQTLLAWIKTETGGGEGEPATTLTGNQQLFADEVLPHLESRQCMNAACHGRFAPFTAFEPPMYIDGETRFSTAAILHNYKAARMHLNVSGDPWLSRLVRKGLPLDAGGIAHRGGNDIFFVGNDGDPKADPAAQAIARWAEAERIARFQPDEPTLDGVVYVRGPLAERTPFDHSQFQPGTDLYVLEPPTTAGVSRNLTASAHPSGPADVRDPAVSHDGKRVAFAMRPSASDALNIYEIGVDGTGFRQLTFDPLALPGGGVATNAQPTYGPDGRVYFVSTRAGMLAHGNDQLDTDVWAVDLQSLVLERITYNPSPESTPSFIGVGKSYGTLAFTMRRTVGGKYEAPVLRMPLDHNKAYHGDPELHIHHGVTADADIIYDLRTLPDGRFSCVLMDRGETWRGGRLAVFDRQFGPELPVGAEASTSMGGFQHPFTVKSDPGDSYRHPVPLADGTLLVTRLAASGDAGLYSATIDDVDGSFSFVTLVDEPGIAEYDAEPIIRRPLEDDPSHEHAWDSTRTLKTGVLAFRHVETLEALFTNLEVRGEKILRDDLVYARLLGWVPTTPNEVSGAPIGMAGAGRTRILGEVPLAGGSLLLEVPSDVPFRVQLLNADRMAVGTQQNRWLHIAPGETFPGGVNPKLYPGLCAGCHGSLSGDRGDVGGPVSDAITSASITLATHDNLNPRRPLDPVSVGDSPLDIDFRRDVSPLLQRSCANAGCHDATAAGNLNLTVQSTALFDTSYEALLSRVGPSAYKSYLLERIMGKELGAPRMLDGTCTGDPALNGDEVLLLIRWVDMGAVYRGVGL